jgi:adenylate kinase
MKNKIAIFGGCSNAGKTTLIDEISKRCGFKNSKKFELIKKEAIKRNISDKALFENFNYLEEEAIKSILGDNSPDPFLLDSHYAIQPKIDNSLAQGVLPSGRVEEAYVLSFCDNAIKELAKNSAVDLFYVYTDIGDIISRRTNNMRNYYVLQRSLDRDNILEEIANEHKMFSSMYDSLANLGGSVKKYEIENKKGRLEDKVTEIISILGSIEK